MLFGDIEPDCKVCRRPDAGGVRAEWGCDRDSTVGGVYRISCVACDGQNRDCQKCDGSGKSMALRCPSSMIDRRTWDAIEAAIDFTERGNYPVPGGRYEQSAQFSRVVQAVSAERAVIEDEKPKKKVT
jgi:hypothetical protein